MRLFLTISMFLITLMNIYAQVPQGMSYQGVIRDVDGELVSNQLVSVRASIVQDSANGPVIYSEIHQIETNANGLISLKIGQGTIISGIFEDIPWELGIFYLRNETDPTGGTNFTISVTSQLLSVPYALYAGNGGTPGPPGPEGPPGSTVMPTIQVFTSDDTWTKPANLKYIVVEVAGGGGGAGGIHHLPTGGAGGGGGGYSKRIIAASSLGNSVDVIVGNGGSGGNDQGSDGEAGGSSSFGSFCSATGGSGGNGTGIDGTSPYWIGGTGGIGQQGDISIAGGDGVVGWFTSGDHIGIGGSGGDSFLGQGAPGIVYKVSPGIDGKPFGGGGGAGAITPDEVDVGIAGGDGAPGVVIVYEYY